MSNFVESGEAMQINPIQKAEENRVALHGQYIATLERLKALGKAEAVASFEAKCLDWKIVMNMRADDVEGYLDAGHHRNIYMKLKDEIQDLETLSGSKDELPNVLEALQKDQPYWYPRRMAYHDRITEEGRVKYGAYCAEGHGVTYYGPFSIFLDPQFVSNYGQMFFAKTDSLNYVDDAYHFDEGRFCKDLCLADNVHQMAIVKHESELEESCDAALEKHCFAMDAARRSYIEAQIYDEIETEHIAEIRLPKSYRDEMLRIPRRRLSGMINFKENKDLLDLLRYDQYKRIHKKSSNLGREIVVYQV